MVSNNLRLGGLITGMDTDSIVRDLMRIERTPLHNKIKEKQVWQWRQEDYRSVNTQLLALRNKAFDMRLQSPYYAKTVTSSAETILTATAASGANEGTYAIKVLTLAAGAANQSKNPISADPANKIATGSSVLSQAHKFDATGQFFEGKTASDTFTVTVQYAETKSKNFTFSYSDSLDSMISTLNADRDIKMSVFYDSGTDKIVLSSNTTGADAYLDVTGDFFSTVLRVDNATKTAGTDAVIELNGLQTTRATNSFTLNGITFNLKGLTPDGLGGAATTVVVQTDTETVYNNIKAFIDQYNEVYQTVSDKVREERFRDYLPLTDEEKEALNETEINKWEEKAKSGLLQNDTILYGTVSEMRRVMASVAEGVSGPRSLMAIGITTGNYWNNQGGQLIIDETKLRAAIADDPAGVYELFTNDGATSAEKGIVRRLYDTLDSSINRIISQAGSGASLVDNSYISRTIRGIDTRIASLEQRLEQVEARYWRQFTAMERAISTMNQQSSWLTSQFTNMQG